TSLIVGELCISFLDPPIKQGQTRYHFLIFEFLKDEQIELEIGLPEGPLGEKYASQLEKEMKGAVYEVVSRIMKTLVNKRITVPGSFLGHSGSPAISCAYKSAAGFLYPLEKGFMYVHKPPLHIRLEEISCVNFERSDVSTRSFDFEIETKMGPSYTFTSIEKDEYGKLYEFVTNKHLRISNVGKRTETVPTEDCFEGSSDEEEERDHYAEKLKREAAEREKNANDTSDEDDSDYKEDDAEMGSDDESSSSSSSESEEEAVSAEEEKDKKKVKKEVKRKHRVRKKKTRIPKDPAAPKKPQSAYFLWFNEIRSNIKEPGMTVGEVAKKAGEMWKEMKDKSKWEKLAEEDRKRYKHAMDTYKQSKITDAPPKSPDDTVTPKLKRASLDDAKATKSSSASEEESPVRKLSHMQSSVHGFLFSL
ncbi:unnamed protein product, partial [Soboliphyme baturini]|uniref:FACT complex subunit SSRP1 n=1 Tax=Soboliphyme baturini TaxID=241478 RepID=A0A183IW06_9BILA